MGLKLGMMEFFDNSIDLRLSFHRVLIKLEVIYHSASQNEWVQKLASSTLFVFKCVRLYLSRFIDGQVKSNGYFLWQHTKGLIK